MTMQETSIAPLLRQLVKPGPVNEEDIEAARALQEQNALSKVQRIVLLGLLHVRKHILAVAETSFLAEVVPAARTKEPDLLVLQDLLNSERPQASSIAATVALVFENRLGPSRCALLLALLAYAGLDRDPQVLAESARAMRQAAVQVDTLQISKCPSRNRYHGGLCDIVGTGGDGHSTFNVSTTASIVASAMLRMAKHGNRASSSTSGSADLLKAIQPRAPRLEMVTASTLAAVYQKSNYAFLFAPVFHPGMKHIAAVRKEIGLRTIFNVLGPLTNPVADVIEAQVVGVAERRMGRIFAEALRLSGAHKAMVVCGQEQLDEISCAGPTSCWYLTADGAIKEFVLTPEEFGLNRHELDTVAGGRQPWENAEILLDLLHDRFAEGNAILDFVLLNAAALLVVAGVCDTVGEKPAKEHWQEGVRLAREAIRSGNALASLHNYIDATHS